MAFNVLDINGDGKVSTDEIKWRFTYSNLQGMPNMRELDEAFWTRLTEDLDADSDGQIYFEDFKRHMN